ncbi:MAG: 50S ribosomal protein L25 [Candidatus Pacebacteria bacterium]|nr:50S ribosomal protein L25 [Candidatus Paceibacterota bacterium]
MLTLKAKKREIIGKKVKHLRKQRKLPAVLYGVEIKNQPLVLDLKEFTDIYKQAGESTMIDLKIEDEKSEIKKVLILIKEIMLDPVTDEFIHVDFYKPALKEKVTVNISLVFKGESPAEKSLGGTLVKNITEIEIKALPQDLPKEIIVDVSTLETYNDNILIKDLIIPSGVEVLKEPEEVIVSVVPQKEEKVEQVVEQEKPEENKEQDS